MNEQLRERVLRKLETLTDERGYQVLDFVDFLESRYATKPESPVSIFTRFAETVEDTLRAGRVSANAVSETMGFMNKAMGVLNGVTAAGKSVVSDVSGTVTKVAANAGAAASAAAAAASAAATGSPKAAGTPSTPVAGTPMATLDPAAPAAPSTSPAAPPSTDDSTPRSGA